MGFPGGMPEVLQLGGGRPRELAEDCGLLVQRYYQDCRRSRVGALLVRKPLDVRNLKQTHFSFISEKTLDNSKINVFVHQ